MSENSKIVKGPRCCHLGLRKLNHDLDHFHLCISHHALCKCFLSRYSDRRKGRITMVSSERRLYKYDKRRLAGNISKTCRIRQMRSSQKGESNKTSEVLKKGRLKPCCMSLCSCIVGHEFVECRAYDYRRLMLPFGIKGGPTGNIP